MYYDRIPIVIFFSHVLCHLCHPNTSVSTGLDKFNVFEKSHYIFTAQGPRSWVVFHQGWSNSFCTTVFAQHIHSTIAGSNLGLGTLIFHASLPMWRLVQFSDVCRKLVFSFQGDIDRFGLSKRITNSALKILRMLGVQAITSESEINIATSQVHVDSIIFN